MFLSLLLFSCNSESEKLKKEIANLTSKEIVLPSDKFEVISKKQKLSAAKFIESELKLIVYSSPENCSSCDISKMNIWNNLINEAQKLIKI